MSDFCLSCCSTVDLNPEWMKKRDLRYVCFRYTLDGVEYPDDMGVSMPSEELFRRMSGGAETKTSQVSVEEYIAHFEGMLAQGLDVLHVTLSTGLTGTYNAACIARDELKERYPDRKLYIVDSLGASSGYGLIMETLADLRDQGKTIDELRDWVEANKLRMHHWFFSTDLSFYIRGREACKRRLLDVMKRSVEEFHRRDWPICIGAAGSFLTKEEGEAWLALAVETFPGEEICYDSLALSIGCHTGPGAFGMAVSRKVGK